MDDHGALPHDWTSANVTPIFKKGKKHLVSNYRPISLTCIAVKLLERLIHNHLSDFLTSHNKLSPSQHGFRAGHSCQSQLLETVHLWAKSIDDAKSSHIAFLDFSKAFDTVPHQRLLLKLHNIGIQGSLLTWIDGFLSHRRQRVQCDGAASHWIKVTSGVPQGSILGPLLFILYINDIGSGLSSHISLFADDCTIFKEISSRQDCDAPQADLNCLFSWTHKWQLSFNTSKCKVMCITNKKKSPQYTYHLNNVPLEWVDTFNIPEGKKL